MMKTVCSHIVPNVTFIFTDWHVSEPNSHGGEEDCAISSSGEDYQWADVPCDGRVAEPLCEVKSVFYAYLSIFSIYFV
jgi:hypothetical protein